MRLNSKRVNGYFNLFFLAIFALALGNLDFALVRRVVRYDASVSQAVNMPLRDKVICVEQSFADTRNADKKSSCMSRLSFTRMNLLRPSSWFRLGNLPGIVSANILPDKCFACFWESSQDFIACHKNNLAINAPATTPMAYAMKMAEMKTHSFIVHPIHKADSRPCSFQSR